MEFFYKSMLDYIRKYPLLEKPITFITKYFPYITFCIYPCLLIYLFFSHNSFLIEAIWKPLGAFLVVTLLRKMINRPRPYESMSIEPLIKHKNGESFPSRHTVSAFIIALICFPINDFLGIFALIVAMLMSVCRVLVGVHYISDIIISVIIALLFYFI